MGRTRRVAPRMALAALAIAAFTSTAQSQQSDERMIRALSDQWQRDIAAQNVDAIVNLHAPDAVVMMSHAPVTTGSTAIRTVWGEGVKTPGLNLHWTPTKIEVMSPTRAIEYGTYTEAYDTPQGKGTDAGSYVVIWHKINSMWRVAFDAPVTSTPLPASEPALAPMEKGDVKLLAGTALLWTDFPRPGFAPGMKRAVLQGDPSAKGPYVLRLQLPAGYRFPVHWHPAVENLTVVSGTFLLAMGNTADSSALKTYAPGDFLHIPARHAHFGGSGAQGPTVIQIHGEGPFQTMLGAPK
jgi:ketosteroid isomerase-like protein/quercetin dioxygenase-like cupin family protein